MNARKLLLEEKRVEENTQLSYLLEYESIANIKALIEKENTTNERQKSLCVIILLVCKSCGCCTRI